MSKFWPVVMWFCEIDGDVLIYKPSRAHHKGTMKYATAYPTWDMAKQQATRMMMSSGIGDLQALPTFIPWVIEGKRPDVSTASTLRLLVQRIRLDK